MPRYAAHLKRCLLFLDCDHIGLDTVTVSILYHTVKLAAVDAAGHFHAVSGLGDGGFLELGSTLGCVVPLIGQAVTFGYHFNGGLLAVLDADADRLGYNGKVFSVNGKGYRIGGDLVAVNICDDAVYLSAVPAGS